MRFREIESKQIRESALSQYADQLGVNQGLRYRLANCYLSFLDYANTVEGYEYWNKVRPLHGLKVSEIRQSVKQVFYSGEIMYYIGEKLSNMMDIKGVSIEDVSNDLKYTEYILEKVCKGRHVGMRFIKDISEYFGVSTKEIIKNVPKKIPEARKKIPPVFPKGTTRVCGKCKKRKDLETEFNKFVHGKLGKSNICRPCNQERSRNYRFKKSKA